MRKFGIHCSRGRGAALLALFVGRLAPSWATPPATVRRR